MGQDGVKLEPEVVEVLRHVRDGRNFLLSGGAGSGKTYSLAQVIGELLRTDPVAAIACITYTNAAVREIESRVSDKRLFVSTIHDFLWAAISPYQAELRNVLIELMKGEAPKINPGSTAVSNGMLEGKAIQYKEYRILDKGFISHDEVLVLAFAFFEQFPKIRNILRDKYRYILVDEYQDTDPAVIKILLDALPQSRRKGVCGFFGDAMQSIYDEGVGNIKSYIDCGVVSEVRKEQNRRNPRLVYELANQLRVDGLEQRASDDITAPNMNNGVVKQGTIRLYYSMGEDDKVSAVRNDLNWDFSDILETKELNLTHNLIAPQAGFEALMDIYNGDGVLAFRDRIVKYIKESGDIGSYDEQTFGEVIAALQKDKTGKALKSVSPTPLMDTFIAAHPQLLAEASNINFLEFRRMFVNKDQLVDDKKQSEDEVARKGSQRCNFINHVFKIMTVVHLYKQRQFNEFLKRTEFRLKSASDKALLKKNIDAVIAMSERPIIETIDFAHENGLCIKDDRFEEFRIRRSYLFNRLIKVPCSVFQKLFEYLEGRTAYSTQHKIKGSEFERVLVVLDAGDWSKYNFNYLFEGSGKDSVRERTQKLFYVCCTRAKDYLAVYFRDPSEASLTQAKAWFGDDNVIKI
ncbi:ATP-dependent helicase [Massilia atriviolacea]|uniref:ATP-dependent helicase n=1 Tax=Massilia atriviolacea TaxID=2495579 RepID=A0A430HKX5_9BURK|nr:UvrD-helicase domain-containing protein [Massilia atriviolacea]RSZ58149.1 ATP-dependent helicase [Massilia atriviolacea]